MIPPVLTASVAALTSTASSTVVVEPATEPVLETSAEAPPAPRAPPGLPWSARPTLEGRSELQGVLGVLIDPNGRENRSGILFGVLDPILWGHSMTIGVTERLQIGVPLHLAYRIGPREGHQLIPHGGVSGIGIGFDDSVIFALLVTAGANLALRFAEVHQLFFGAQVTSFGQWSSRQQTSFESWRASASVGYSITALEFITIALGVSAAGGFIEQGRAVNPFRAESDLRFGVGSVVTVAGRRLPLLRLHVSDAWSIDGHAALSFARGEPAVHSYLLGFTLNW